MSNHIKLHVLPKFPSRVVGGDGITITKLNGIWTVSTTAIFTSPAPPVTDGGIVVFSGTGGQSVADSGVTLAGLTTANNAAYIRKDGTSIISANIPMANHKLTELADGTVFGDAIHFGQVPEKLTAARTYYVRTDGIDTQTGLVDSAGGAFRTWQRAATVASGLNTNGFDVTCKHGTESGVKTFTITGLATTVPSIYGGGNIRFEGSSTPGNTVIVGSGVDCFLLNNTLCKVYFKNIDLQTGVSGLINVVNQSTLVLEDGVRFLAATFAQVYVHDNQAQCLATSVSFSHRGSASYAFFSNGGMIFLENCPVAIANSPVWAGGYVGLFKNASFQFSKIGGSFAAGATGPRFSVASNSTLDLGSDAETIFPGNSAGSVASGGECICVGNVDYPINAQGTGGLTLQSIATGPITLSRNTSVTGTFGVSGAATLSGGVAITGAGTFTTTMSGPQFKPNASSSTTHAVDATASATFAVANGGNQTLPTMNAGLMIITDNSTGNWALYGGDGAVGTKMISEEGTAVFVIPTTTPAAGKACIAWNGSTYAVYNNIGSSQSFRVFTIRTR